MKKAGSFLCALFLPLIVSTFSYSENSAAEKQKHFQKALELKTKKKVNEALKELQEAIHLDPLYVEAHRLYMDLMESQGKSSEIKQKYQLMLNQNPNSAIHNYLYGRTLKNPHESIRLYLMAHQIDKNLVWPYVALGYTYTDLSQYKEALYYLNEGLRLQPTNTLLISNLANLYKRQKQLQKAIETYKLLVNDSELGLAATITLGHIFNEMQNHKQAKLYYEKAIQMATTDPEVYFQLGSIYYDTDKKFDKALDAFQQCLKLDPKDSLASNNVGAAYQFAKKDLKQAEKYYKLSAETNPNYALPRKNLIKIYLNQEKYQEASKYIEETKKLEPLDSNLYTDLGIIYNKTGKYYQALDQFRIAFDLDKQPYPGYWNLGLMYEKAGEYDNAVKLYKLLQQAQPENPVQDSMKERLPYLQKVLNNTRVQIENVFTEPSIVRSGGVVDLILEYSISGTDAQTLLLTEDRRILIGDTLLGSAIVDFRNLSDGKYKSTVRLSIPKTAKPGNYIYSAWIKLCGAKSERLAAFRIAL